MSEFFNNIYIFEHLSALPCRFMLTGVFFIEQDFCYFRSIYFVGKKGMSPTLCFIIIMHKIVVFITIDFIKY